MKKKILKKSCALTISCCLLVSPLIKTNFLIPELFKAEETFALETQALYGKKPNIIFIMLDDAGYGDFACNDPGFIAKDYVPKVNLTDYSDPTKYEPKTYNLKSYDPNSESFYSDPNYKIQTPFINLISKNGVNIEQTYGCPVCSPARASLLSGGFPLRTGITNVPSETSTYGLRSSIKTIPEYLKTANYETHMVGKWHLGHLEQYNPLYHGFDDFFGGPLAICQEPYNLYRNLNSEKVFPDQTKVYDMVGQETDEAIKIIKKSSDKPFFIDISYALPHYPVVSPLSNTVGDVGEAMRYIDNNIGRIMNALYDKKKLNNTLLIVTSDNGGEDVDTLTEKYPIKKRNGGLTNKKHTVYEGGIRIPFVAQWPDYITPSREVINTPISIVDMLPTFANLAGIPLQNTEYLDGEDISSLLQGNKFTRKNDLLFFIGNYLKAIISKDNWKYINIDNGKLYNLNVNKEESDVNNLILSNPDIANKFKEKFSLFSASSKEYKTWPKDSISKDPNIKIIDVINDNSNLYMTDTVTLSNQSGSYNNTLNVINPEGKVVFNFEGTMARIKIRTSSDSGVLKVSLDGKTVSKFDAYCKNGVINDMTVYVDEKIPAGDHSLQIVNTGNKHILSKGYNCYLDAIQFMGEARSIKRNDLPLNIVNDDGDDLKYNGNWRVDAKKSYKNKDIHYSNTPGNYAEFKFSGTSLNFNSKRGINGGKFDIYIDNVYNTTIDSYSEAEEYKWLAFKKRGLKNSQHTLKIVVSKDKNPLSKGRYCYVDFFRFGVSEENLA